MGTTFHREMELIGRASRIGRTHRLGMVRSVRKGTDDGLAGNSPELARCLAAFLDSVAAYDPIELVHLGHLAALRTSFQGC
jgi:hypothetical protein